MAVVRRNILLEPAARESYIRGVLLLKQEMQGNSGLSTYDSFVVWHHQTMMPGLRHRTIVWGATPPTAVRYSFPGTGTC